jgi:riboflavin synthase alpha subunit
MISLPINGVKKERFVVTLFSEHTAKLTQLKSLQRTRQTNRNSTDFDFISTQSAMLLDRP